MKLVPINHDPFTKVAKASVSYSRGMKSSHCGICKFYKNRACSKVGGEIDPAYWCRLFKKKIARAGGGEVSQVVPEEVEAPQASLMDQAKQQYPILNNYDIGYKNNVGGGSGYMESWPPGETGTPSTPRPSEFPPTQFGVENYRADSKPSDVMADIVSRHLVNVDPTVKKTYKDFSDSLEPWQNDILKQQYQHAKDNEGETRPYEKWKDATGLPGYFHGYTFQQWPDDFNKQAYTPQQTQKLDQMMQYLRGNPQFSVGGSVKPRLISVAHDPWAAHTAVRRAMHGN